jgi:hypothetical protein
MRRRLIDTLEAVIAAERLAAELRRTHGRRAEQICDAMLVTGPGDEVDRESLRDVRRALRWV